MPILLALGLTGFAAALATRLADPLVALISDSFSVSVETVALLATVFSVHYALTQPVLGALGDAKGKERVILICMGLEAVSLIACGFTDSMAGLFVLRAITGLTAGGVIPLSLALIGDRTALSERQAAISRYLLVVILAQTFGAPLAGWLSHHVGWRGVFIAAGLCTAALATVAASGLLKDHHPRSAPFSLSSMRASYALVLANPKAKICYGAVFTEGIAIFGLFPFVAPLMLAAGTGGPTEAGFVLGGFGLGGILAALLTQILFKRVNSAHLMRAGGLLIALGLVIWMLSPNWFIGAAGFSLIGFGFYILHPGLQAQATELAPSARGSALALHAFSFFVGAAAGPALTAPVLSRLGVAPVVLIDSILVAALGFFVPWALARIDQRAR